jgi:hypothetical protein
VQQSLSRGIAPLAILLVCSALVATVGALPAHAGSGAGLRGVTVVFSTNNEPELRHLAHARGIGRLQRVAAARSAAPSVAERQTVRRFAADLGLHVSGDNLFSMHLAGSSTNLAAFQERMQQADSASIVIADARPRFLRPLDLAIDGPTARSVYDAPSGQAPNGDTEPTVATIELSGWDDTGLTEYASAVGLPDPVATGQYTAISVDGADPTQPDGTGGNDEVALDQEALLATAPYLGQRAYFAPNIGPSGIVDALNQVATDALDASHDYYNLAAVSISWGQCEASWLPNEVDALDQAVVNALAAGVTVFAASGDNGAYDCPDDPSPAVDMPASDPSVVGVGGITLVSPGSFPVETAWYDPTDGSGSGGGVSNIWLEPDYQKGQVTADGRVVPDIALDADPSTGFTFVEDGQVQSAGGTSLATPLAAGTFADLLATQGFDSGIGDILPNLYSAPASDFRDITTGQNGAYNATTGYDAVTGLGAPLWNRLTDSLLGYPTLHAPIYSRSRSIPVQVSVPQGMHYSSWEVGTGTEPSYCLSTPTSTSPPTSIRAPSDGKVKVWVAGDTDGGWCFSDAATVTVDSVQPSARLAATVRHGRLLASWSVTDATPSSGLTPVTISLRIPGRGQLAQSQFTSVHVASIPVRRGTTYLLTLTVHDHAGNGRLVQRRIAT